MFMTYEHFDFGASNVIWSLPTKIQIRYFKVKLVFFLSIYLYYWAEKIVVVFHFEKKNIIFA